MALQKQMLDGWQKALKSALEADTWGQSLEAVEEYQKLARLLDTQVPQLNLSVDERSTLMKVKVSALLRTENLQDLSRSKGISLEQAKKLPDVLKNVFSGSPGAFPIPLAQYTAVTADFELPKRDVATRIEVQDAENKQDVASADSGGGSLLPPLAIKRSGVTTIAIHIDKIGLKDAQTYLDSRMTVTVINEKGAPVGQAQDTPITNRKEDSYVLFGNTVHIQSVLEEFRPGCAIFFEFKHYKPQKKKVSTRCFAFMESDELKSGNDIVLEL